ncbi:MAG: ABC transporter permease [Lachnospiraceae bacterium]|nr:ABC transporter permease [Lachnospiraceae bacterium]
MKLRDYIYLAGRNIVSKRKSRLAIGMMFAFMGVLVFLCGYLNFTLQHYLNSIQKGRFSECYLYAADGETIGKIAGNRGKIPGVSGISIVREMDTVFGRREISELDLVLDRQVHSVVPSGYLDMFNTRYLNVCEYDLTYEQFSGNEEREFRYYNKKEPLYLHGTELQEAGQVVLSDNLLEKYGVGPEEWKELVGKSFSVVNHKNGKTLFGTYTISGIINSKALHIAGRGSDLTYIFFASGKGFSYETATLCKLYIDSYQDVNRIKEFINSELGLSVQSSFAADSYENVAKLQDSLSEVFGMILLLIGIICIANLGLIFIYEFHCNCGYLGIIRAYGITKKDMRKLLWAEYGMIAAGSVLVATAGNILLRYFIDQYVIEGIDPDIISSNGIFAVSVGMAVFIVLFMYYLLSLVLGYMSHRWGIHEMIKR